MACWRGETVPYPRCSGLLLTKTAGQVAVLAGRAGRTSTGPADLAAADHRTAGRIAGLACRRAAGRTAGLADRSAAAGKRLDALPPRSRRWIDGCQRNTIAARPTAHSTMPSIR